MGAKVTLTGPAMKVRTRGGVVSFKMVTGPATKSAPKGLKLFGPSTYLVSCSDKQWRKARYGDDDDSDLVVEGFLEPRQDEQTGKLCVAVVATMVKSMRRQNEQKLVQLTKVLDEALAAYKAAREAGAGEEALRPKAEALVKAQQSVERFRQRHPELTGPEAK